MDHNELLNLDVNGFTSKKNGLTYLSWAHAWREFIKVHPAATYVIKKNEYGTPEFGNSRIGYMVYTSVTVDSITKEMWLPVLNGANKPLKDEAYTITNKWGKETNVDAIDMFNINTSVMRCLTKNLAMFGLGLYIYAGEDIPEEIQKTKDVKKEDNITNAPSDEDFVKQIKELIDNYFGTPKGEIVDATLEKCLKFYKVDKVEDIPKDKLKATFNKLVKAAM